MRGICSTYIVVLSQFSVKFCSPANMPTDDRVLRGDAVVLKTVETVLKSEELLQKIGNIIAEKIDQKIDQSIKTYEVKVSQLEDKLEKAYATIDSLEQYTRRNSLRIYGLPESVNEDTDASVIKFYKEKMNIEVSKEMIDCSHRLGKEENHTKPLLVKFVSKNIKQEIYKNKRKLKGSKLVIKEDLTKKNIQLMKRVRDKFKTVWTNNCSIFTKVNNKIYKINDLSDLSKINLNK